MSKTCRHCASEPVIVNFWGFTNPTPVSHTWYYCDTHYTDIYRNVWPAEQHSRDYEDLGAPNKFWNRFARIVPVADVGSELAIAIEAAFIYMTGFFAWTPRCLTVLAGEVDEARAPRD